MHPGETRTRHQNPPAVYQPDTSLLRIHTISVMLFYLSRIDNRIDNPKTRYLYILTRACLNYLSHLFNLLDRR